MIFSLFPYSHLGNYQTIFWHAWDNGRIGWPKNMAFITEFEQYDKNLIHLIKSQSSTCLNSENGVLAVKHYHARKLC